MRTPLRILRREAQDRRHPAPPSARDLEREALILDEAEASIARHGWHYLTFNDLAASVEMSPHTLRRHFADIESVLERLLFDHLMAISKAMSQVSPTAPEAPRLRRAAYLKATRHPLGGPSRCHHILLMHQSALPDDVLVPLETLRRTLGELLAGAQGEFALNLLDQPYLAHDMIEHLLQAATGYEASQKPATLAPEPPPPRVAPARTPVCLPADLMDMPEESLHRSAHQHLLSRHRSPDARLRIGPRQQAQKSFGSFLQKRTPS